MGLAGTYSWILAKPIDVHKLFALLQRCLTLEWTVDIASAVATALLDALLVVLPRETLTNLRAIENRAAGLIPSGCPV